MTTVVCKLIFVTLSGYSQLVETHGWQIWVEDGYRYVDFTSFYNENPKFSQGTNLVKVPARQCRELLK